MISLSRSSDYRYQPAFSVGWGGDLAIIVSFRNMNGEQVFPGAAIWVVSHHAALGALAQAGHEPGRRLLIEGGSF